jgi:branched-chain amino acid transport system substrate-binding protein
MTVKSTTKKSIPPIAYVGLFLLLWGGFSGIKQLFSNPASSDSAAKSTGSRLSAGTQSFFPEDGTQDKLDAIKLYKSGSYEIASTHFERSLQQKPNDPESLIYRNNAAALTKNPLTIAVSIPAKTDANGAREVLRGVAQAQTEINNTGGINTRPLAVTIANDDNDVKTAQQVAQDLVDRPEVLGVVGHLASSITLATADIYAKGKLVSISPVSSAVQLSNKSPYLFRTIPSDSITARALTEHMIGALNAKRAVIYFNSESDYSRSLKGELNTAIALQGGQVVREYDLANDNFNPNLSLKESQQSNADVIILASNTSTLNRAFQVVKANKSRLPILGGDDVYTSETLEVVGAWSQNMFVAVPWHILGSGSQNFAARSRKLWGGDVNWRTAMAYDATQALGTALQLSMTLQSFGQTREAVQATLRQPDFTAIGASRNVAFLPSGDRNAPVQLVKIIEGSRSTHGYDFVPIR